ncbi:MAG: aminotransferase class I/II-fold pyridoxal phosphate-dependent enzyme [Gammaproteobacteria bacterium]|nr:aminotransferase class I/II-fold pyridoxal phosphate-dependent enzyme [Gammaproteobacteria bacterium]
MNDVVSQNIRSHYDKFSSKYQSFLLLDLSLDMTRGKPSPTQLNLSDDLLSLPGTNYQTPQGTDTRNYGILDGLPGIKSLFAELLGVQANQVIVGGNSSLTMMYDTLQRACQFGVPGGDSPWNSEPNRKFLCPTPGYDRHFLITQHLGFELINIDITDTGPDMDQVEWLVKNDPTIKGIWCIPKYSNPTGCCYSPETVKRLAAMPTAATDFRIMWDNAYAEHHFNDNHPELDNIANHSQQTGNENRAIQFASTSKMTLPGAGVAAMAASEENIADAKKHLNVQGIGPDKVNQLRHLQFFGDIAGLRRHMKEHAKQVKPKFDLVDRILHEELSQWNIASWTKPEGGYFISLDVTPGLARKVIELSQKAGVKLTGAGAPFPYV